MLLRTRLPPSGFIEPCLPSSAERPPSGPGWIHEIKHDGYRLTSLLRGSLPGLRLNEHLAHDGESVFRHACKLGLEGIVSKRLGSRYRSGRSKDWLKFKNPDAPAMKREAEEEWGKERWR
jgi:ATP-dependent DNA ligase